MACLGQERKIIGHLEEDKMSIILRTTAFIIFLGYLFFTIWLMLQTHL